LLERRVLKGRLAEGLNACFECCDRWSGDGRLALEWISRDLVPETVTFRALQDAAGRFANLLRSYDIGAGDVVAGLLPRIPELLVVVLGTWRVGAIYQPLFTAFGPAAIHQRVTHSDGSQAKSHRFDADDFVLRPEVRALERCCFGDGMRSRQQSTSADNVLQTSGTYRAMYGNAPIS
jgi:acyl-CoA synthetase (AMP-forming)/AMP-acid ligase II